MIMKDAIKPIDRIYNNLSRINKQWIKIRAFFLEENRKQKYGLCCITRSFHNDKKN